MEAFENTQFSDQTSPRLMCKSHILILGHSLRMTILSSLYSSYSWACSVINILKVCFNKAFGDLSKKNKAFYA